MKYTDTYVYISTGCRVCSARCGRDFSMLSLLPATLLKNLDTSSPPQLGQKQSSPFMFCFKLFVSAAISHISAARVPVCTRRRRLCPQLCDHTKTTFRTRRVRVDRDGSPPKNQPRSLCENLWLSWSKTVGNVSHGRHTCLLSLFF